MALDPQARELIDTLTASTPPLESLTPVRARAMADERRARAATRSEEVRRIAHREIPGPGGPLALRLYYPMEQATPAVVVFFHGGGWVIGGLDSHDPLCRTMANAIGAVVVSVDYRLAPEHPFPAAVDDAFAATTWVAEHGTDVGADPNRIAVAGDSSGANLAAVTALRCRHEAGPDLSFQLLIYPITDGGFSTTSYRENGEGYYVTEATMRWFRGHYVPNEDDRSHPHASPLRAPDLSGLPPALVITAEYDPLRDEGEAYGRRLAAAGVPATVSRYDGMFHGFFSLGTTLDAGLRANEEAWSAMRRALEGARTGEG